MRKFLIASAALLIASPTLAQGVDPIARGLAAPLLSKTYAHLPQSQLLPSQHLAKFVASSTPTVCYLGDSTIAASPVQGPLTGLPGNSPIDSLSGMLTQRIRQDNPQKTITFKNFGIGSQSWSTLSGVATANWPSFYFNHALPWLPYVQAANCTSLYINLGINDANGFSASSVKQVLSSIKNWANTPASWAATTAVSANAIIADSNGKLEIASTGGTTGSSQPTWPSTVGTSTTDGTVTWQLLSSAAYVAQVPDLVLITNKNPNPNAPGYGTTLYQQGTLNAAAYTRAMALSPSLYGLTGLPAIGLIDVGRYFAEAFNGADPVEQPLTQVVAASTTNYPLYSAGTNTESIGPSPSWDTSTQKFGSAAINAGTYLRTTTGNGPMGTSGWSGMTLECWAKTSSTASIKVVCGQNSAGWIGITSNGIQASYGSNGNSVNLTTSGAVLTSFANGAWHHVELDVDASGGRFYIDGSLVSSSGTSYAASAVAQSSTFDIGNLIGTYLWGGEVDEVSVWPYAKHTGSTFTVPTSAYTGSEGMVALYHLDVSGVDSAASPTVTFPATGGDFDLNFTVNNGSSFVSGTNTIVLTAGSPGSNSGSTITFSPSGTTSSLTYADGSGYTQTFSAAGTWNSGSNTVEVVGRGERVYVSVNSNIVMDQAVPRFAGPFTQTLNFNSPIGGEVYTTNYYSSGTPRAYVPQLTAAQCFGGTTTGGNGINHDGSGCENAVDWAVLQATRFAD